MSLPSASGATIVRLVRPATSMPPLRVLLLHGLASSSTVWSPLLPALDSRLELWAAELPWCAHNAPGWPTEQADADAVRRAVEAVGGGVDVVLAHSFGANALLELLDSNQVPRLRAVVLLAPFYRPHAHDFDWATVSYYVDEFRTMLEDGVRARSGGRVAAAVRREMACHLRDRIGPRGWVRFFATYLRTPELSMERLRLPTLVVVGDRDFAAPPSDGRALAEGLPDGRLVTLADCGHFPMADQAHVLAEIVEGFIRSLAPEPMVEAPARGGNGIDGR